MWCNKKIFNCRLVDQITWYHDEFWAMPNTTWLDGTGKYYNDIKKLKSHDEQ